MATELIRMSAFPPETAVSVLAGVARRANRHWVQAKHKGGVWADMAKAWKCEAGAFLAAARMLRPESLAQARLRHKMVREVVP